MHNKTRGPELVPFEEKQALFCEKTFSYIHKDFHTLLFYNSIRNIKSLYTIYSLATTNS